MFSSIEVIGEQYDRGNLLSYQMIDVEIRYDRDKISELETDANSRWTSII